RSAGWKAAVARTRDAGPPTRSSRRRSGRRSKGINKVLDALVAVVHALAGAAWFGAMFYSTFVLHPRARTFFERDADFEAFIATVSHGARWKVLGAIGLVAATGTVLALSRGWHDASSLWLVLIGAKALLLLAAFALFIR